LASCLCIFCWAKHHRAFVEVVEGSELYNIAYYLRVHFSSQIGRKPWSKQSRSNCLHARTPRARDVAPRALRRLRHRTRTPRPCSDH
jgi:hypothetical protein